MCQSLRNRTGEECKQTEHQGKSADSMPRCDSAIRNHLLRNKTVHLNTSTTNVFSFSKARSDFRLPVSESVFITLRKRKLCRQKEFV